MNNKNYDNRNYFINRELSWLEFNHRVLEEAQDENNPLFERLKFISIFSSNLDEFFMVRVASLKDQVNVGFEKKDPSGLSPKQQLKYISTRAHELVEEQYKTLNEFLVSELEQTGFYFLSSNELSKENKEYLEELFTTTIYPVLTPMAVDSSRPFPLLLNKSLNIGILIRDEEKEDDVFFATVQVPSVLSRLIKIPSTNDNIKKYIFLEEVIDMFIDKLFSGKEILCSFPYRISRNADLSIHEDEAEDLLIEIEKSLKMRRWGEAIRLEVDSKMDKRLVNILKDSLEIHKGEIYYIDGPIDLSFIMKTVIKSEHDVLKFENFTPQTPNDLLGEDDIFEAISRRDIFLHHPFESFDPVVNFIKKAAKDSKVLAIKQTLYRVSGDSPIVKSLAQAADRGKQVTVLVELKARFDEENNIIWAKRLEKSGCHVIYGLVGLKTHSKITLVVRNEENKIKRYVHLGTGNYNDITAKLYTDMGLFTCNERFGSDASAIFNMLSGYSEPPELFKIDFAPLTLRNKFMELIENEIRNKKRGKEAKIIAKMNSLVDPGIIKALYIASSNGVKIDLIVRGICCLKPGIPDISENIRVRSIVGRFLEHSRIFYFLNDGREDLFLSSADWMPRNLNRRVELLFPIENNSIKNRILSILEIMLRDNQKSREMKSNGQYFKVYSNEENILNSQEYFLKRAAQRVQDWKKENQVSSFEPIIDNR